GTFLGYVGSAIDVTNRRELEASLHFLRVASVDLASSLEYRETLRSLARVAVPVLADWCAVDILQKDGTIERMAAAHLNPASEQFIFERHRRFPPALSAARGVGKVLRTGEPEFIPEMTLDVLADAATSPEHMDLLRALGMRSVIIVPLVARGRVLGSMQVVLERSDRRYGTDDLWLAQQLASQAALEVDNARLFEGEARARQQAEAAIRLRDEFLGVAAHELRTPLAILRGFSQLLSRHFATGEEIDPEKRQRYLRAIDDQTEKLNRLVGQLLDVSQIEQGRLVLVKERVNIATLAREVVANVQQGTETQNLIALIERDVWAEIDPLRIEQVLINLLANAIRYSPEQGPIEVNLDQPDPETARIVVRDHGLGIPPDRRDHMFNLFYQAHQDSYRSGLGIGLYISREIVQSHGGDIRAEFPDDGGARFIVTLPTGQAAGTGEGISR
ncbi:MAG TPA: ATP-binding protein, partial [Chloroflexota bacterium]|nr:ATP-binding protein [Chloroflexota bacterium]